MRARCLVLASLAGCAGPHLKREIVGAGSLQASPTGVPIQLGRGRYDLALMIDTPRAAVVQYVIACGDLFERRGQLGETGEQYRARRLAQLNAQQQRDRATAGAVVAALAPSARVHATQTTPTSTTTVDAHVSGQAIGTAVAADAFPEITQLAPGDVGAAHLQVVVPVTLGVDTTCTLTTTADDPTVLASYQLTHVRNLDAEAAERREIATTHAIEVRGALTAQLTATGADPLARQKRLEARARARAAAEADRLRARMIADARRAKLQADRDAARSREADAHARAQAELDAKLELDAHLELELAAQHASSARYTRTLLVGYLEGECHADPYKRQRDREAHELKIQLQVHAKLDLEAKLRAEREAREAQRRAEREAREAKLHAEEEARAAVRLEEQRRRDALEQHRVTVALAARADLRAYLMTLGARERPPMPALLVEAQGPQPFDGAVWIAGTWRWTGGQWMWIAGGWEDSTRFGASGNAGVAIAAETRDSSDFGAVSTTATTAVTTTAGSASSTGPTATSVSLPTGLSAGGAIAVGGGISVQVPVIHVHGGTHSKPTSGPVVRDHRHK